MSDPTYDPKTCITAGELRGMGVPVSKTVPDCAWIPLRALRHVPGSVKAVGDGFEFKVEVTEPFRWVEATISLKEEK